MAPRIFCVFNAHGCDLVDAHPLAAEYTGGCSLPPIADVRADESGRAIRASNEVHVTLRDYLRLATDPLILAMGLGYFFIKFLRYALDSWLPTFLKARALPKRRQAYGRWVSISAESCHAY